MTAPLRRRALALGAIAVAGACSGGHAQSTATSTTLGRDAVTTTVRPDDGVLRLGVLLPRSGTGEPFGQPLVTAVDLAVEEINAAGGVNGSQVQVVATDEGDSVAAAAKGVAKLIDAGVDAVVGPASSRIALAVLGPLVDHGIVTCSPTATAIALSGFPDDGRFIRTVPSDALQAVAMAEVVERAGVGSATILAPDDSFGRPYVAALTAALNRRGIAVKAQVMYQSSDQDHSDDVRAALAASPGAVALVGNEVSGRQVLEALDQQAPKGLPVVVNDALRRPGAADATPLETAHADVTGTSPRSMPIASATWFAAAMASREGVDVADVDLAFAANAYDCVNLIATAALAAGHNDAAGIVASVREVSAGGASCGNFVTCAPFLAQGRNIDLNGVSGPLDLDAEGDVAVGLFDKFRFDETGRDVTVGDLQVTAA